MAEPIHQEKGAGVLHPDEERASLESFTTSLDKADLLSQEHTDPILNAKMRLVNDVR